MHQISVCTCFQRLMLQSKLFFTWLSQILLFSIHTSFLTHYFLKYLHCKTMIFVYRVFFWCNWKQTSRSPALKCWMHFLWLQVFLCVFVCFVCFVFSLLGEICSCEFYQFYLVEKNPRIILVCRSDALLMD